MTNAINITADVASEASNTLAADMKGKRASELARTACSLAFAVFSFLPISAVSSDYVAASIV